MSQELRRLAAIVFTDMVGYTTLAQSNESLALQLLEKHNTLLRSELGQHRGREVKTIGDAFLLEFDSALEAVQCAIKIQTAFREQNISAKESEKMLLRIGIHVGDVIQRGGDVFGDAVNIASRIVSFAEEGGICISEQVYAQVRNKIQNRMVEIPDQPLKHVEQPMNLYEVVLPWEEKVHSRPVDRRMRIAVLPFTNISPEPRDSYFADGLTEELISALSEVQGLRVIARTSINRYRETTKSVLQIGSELEVAHVLEGSVRKAGNKIRVFTQLIEVESQEHVWSNRYDRDLEDVFSIQSDIAKQVVDSLKLTLLKDERSRIEKKDTENLAAYVAYLKGRTMFQDRTERAMKFAKEQFELAIREDTTYARAYAGLADIHMLLGDYLFAPVPSSLGEARQNVEKALELDPDLPEAHVSLALFLLFEYNFGEAENEFKRAIALNPSNATAHHWFASLLESMGHPEQAFKEVLIAEKLDPLSLSITLSVVYRCIGAGKYDEVLRRIKQLQEIDSTSPMINEALMAYHFARKEWENALSYLRKMIDEDPLDPYLDADLAYINAVTGKSDEALKLLEKLKSVPESARTKGTLIAFVYSGLDNLDECFRWLEYAFETRELFFGWFRNYPLLKKIREDKRFSILLERARLPASNLD
ncbi:MAG: adenylate/guanylate cyclase domain-containing protein [Nitrososphaerales archaeon]